jgi:hypothetical protein
MCEAKEKIKRLRALGSKPRKKRHGAKTRITKQRRSNNTKRRVIDSKLGSSAMRAYPVMITGPEIWRYKSAELQQLCTIRYTAERKKNRWEIKRKGGDGTAHPSPVHNPPFQKNEAKSFM